MVDTVEKKVTGGRVQYRNGAGRRTRNPNLSPEQQAVANQRRTWEEGIVANSLKRLPERVPADQFTTISGEPINRIYTPADLAGFDYEKDLSFPGQYPFTR